MKWKLCWMFVLVHIEYGTPQRHRLMIPAKGDNKDLAEGEDKNYPSRLKELTISRRQAMNGDNYRDQGQGARPRVRAVPANRGTFFNVRTGQVEYQGQGASPRVRAVPANRGTFFNARTGQVEYQGQGARPRVRAVPANQGQQYNVRTGQDYEQNDPRAQSKELEHYELMSRIQNLEIVPSPPLNDQRPPLFAALRHNVLAKPAIPVQPVVRQNPVSGQQPVATVGNCGKRWQLAKIGGNCRNQWELWRRNQAQQRVVGLQPESPLWRNFVEKTIKSKNYAESLMKQARKRSLVKAIPAYRHVPNWRKRQQSKN